MKLFPYLVVIAVCVSGCHQHDSRSLMAVRQCLQLQGAINAVIEHYGKFPRPDDSSEPMRTDPSLMKILTGMEVPPVWNTEKVEFFGNFKKSQRVEAEGLRDPWGNFYYVYVNTEGEGAVPAIPLRSVKAVGQRVIVVSSGEDGRLETANDNISGIDDSLL